MAESGVTYIMQRDYLASARLNLQHYFWRQLWPTLLDSRITTEFSDKPFKVADVGTGTGIWAFALADELPNVDITGLDIVTDQYPHKSVWPKNAKMGVWDFKTAPPKELLGAFDVVNIGVIAVVIENDDPSSIIQNVAKLLKPGGYLQWDEYIFAGAKVEKVAPDADTPGLEALGQAFSHRFKTSWIAKLELFLDANGFKTIDKTVKREKPWQRKMLTESFLMGMKEAAGSLRAEGQIEKADKSDRDLGFAVEELKHGNYVSIEFQNVLAKKT